MDNHPKDLHAKDRNGIEETFDSKGKLTPMNSTKKVLIESKGKEKS